MPRTSNSPAGGQGIGLGVHDAVNLGWKLAQVVKDISPHGLLDTYHCERHPAAARALKHTMAQSFLQRSDVRIDAVRDTIADMLSFDGPRKLVAGLASGLDVGYDLGEGHPLLGRRMPDLDLITPDGPLRVFTLLHEARPVLLNLGKPGSIDITPWADRVQHIDADYRGTWDLPVLGAVTGPAAVLIRPDGHVAWVGDGTQTGLGEALTTWFGPPVEPRRESARLRARRPWAQVGDPRRRTSQEHERGAERSVPSARRNLAANSHLREVRACRWLGVTLPPAAVGRSVRRPTFRTRHP
jgi:hypothetical protein